jgi:hypothetical protein
MTRHLGIKQLLCAALAVALLMGVDASARAAASEPEPAWSIRSFAQPTSFSAEQNVVCENHGDCDHYTIAPVDVGTRASSGTVVVKDELPAGLEVAGRPEGRNAFMFWECAVEALGGQEIVTCESAGSVPPLTPAADIVIPVTVALNANAMLVNHVEIAGGGSVSPALAGNQTAVTQQPAVFEPLGFTASWLDSDGAPATRAGSHPGGFAASFAFPSEFKNLKGQAPTVQPVETVKQIVTDLPVGVIGDAVAAGTCPLSDLNDIFNPEEQEQCPPSSRIGELALVGQAGYEALTIFNVVPEHGYAAEFAVFLPEFHRGAMLYARLVGSGPNAHVRVVSAPQDSAITDEGVSLTFFGDPTLLDGAPFQSAPFFTNPSDCEASGFTSTIYVDTWQHPGRMLADNEPDLGDPNWKRESSTSPPVTGCERLRFEPSFALAPEAEHVGADEPAGYRATLSVPQNEDPNGLATPPLRRTTVTLPAGVAISPAAADGLAACQETGPQGIELESPNAGHCPPASSIGSAEVRTPLLKEPLQGRVYAAQPTCGGAGQPQCTEAAAEEGGVFALYLEAGNDSSGVHIKLRGTVEVGGNGPHSRAVGLAPGQVRTTFAETPQQPFSELKLSFDGGPRAALANPQTCGTFTTVAQFEAWSHAPAPGEALGTPDVTQEPSFAIAGCENRFAPGFIAGTANPQAGAFSAFTATFSRQDREQDLGGLSVRMPAGLLGKIAGVARCAEAQANVGSCPAASRIGTATAAAGSGSQPLWQSGAVYLTGPYKGAPFGLAVVVPAVAGPFDLGNIVVRAAIEIDPRSAQVTVVSDPLPQSVDGVPLRVKTVNVTVGQERAFTLNPTSCDPASVNAIVSSTQGTQVPVASRFQAANCASLPFKPSFKASTAGRTSRGGGASLTVNVASGAGQANIAKVTVSLPKQLPSYLKTLQKACTAAVFDANPASCPAGAVVGSAKASTPLLDAPLSGPAYLVSHGGEAFPDLVIVLQGEGVTLELTGNTKIKNGITSSTFESVPDAPITVFRLDIPQGENHLLAANLPASAGGSLCHQTLRMPTTITGQNGAVLKQTTKVAPTGCSKRKAKSTRRAHRHSKRRQRGKPNAK